MSVTFSAEYVSTGRFYVVGMTDTDEVRFGPYESYEAAVEARLALPEAEYVYGRFVQAESLTDSLPEVNVSNTNALDLLLALDLLTLDHEGADLCGSEDSSSFRARVLVALATDRLDAEEPAYTLATEGAATWHFGGRREGYVTEKLTALLAVAEAAEGYGVRVTWG